MMRRGGLAAAWLALAALLAGCPSRPQETAKPQPLPEAAIPVTFTDVTRAAGIAFTHTNGARGRKYLPETMGSTGPATSAAAPCRGRRSTATAATAPSRM
jgi:nitrous oxide reductase accessory protein NosL